jgi:hypothetical protein
MIRIHDSFVLNGDVWMLIERDAFWAIQRMGNFGARNMGRRAYIRNVWKRLRTASSLA